ncbi:hypothetical protein [Paenibacillus segetis]|uniref:Lipoprotein n=1 Tax=Paenibacillus segetis TaxID=1325360 RepID=A0ABQ1YNV4_9BACL|nr:hypothetical protein [Paenibacillus segetis]GGH33146.1 hypothetical protein GCM10008013_38020 [Paenibacillus segetis]
MKNMQIVMSASLLTLLLLSGCAANQANEAARNSVNTNGQNSEVDNSTTENDSKPGNSEGKLDESQMQMTNVLRSLVMMDGQEGLEITKEQANSLLPIVQEMMTSQQMTDEIKTNIVEKLSNDQQTYLSNMESNMPGKPEDGEIPQGSDIKRATDNEGQPPQGVGGPNGERGGDMNPGEQLIELLQTKIS